MGYRVEATGTDAIGANIYRYESYINAQRAKGDVILYVNGPVLRNSTAGQLKNWTATHFIKVMNFSDAGNGYNLQYWDYGGYSKTNKSWLTMQTMLFGVFTLIKQ